MIEKEMADTLYRRFCVGGISLSPDEDEAEACRIAAKQMKRAGINPARLRFDIYKRSVDARKRQDVKIVYSVAVSSQEGVSAKALSRVHGKVTPINDAPLDISYGSERAAVPPLVVGMGPCGLFCALLLAEHGYCPTVIDRGDGISARVEKTKRFFESGELDTESNIQFGAGGAGTFSDGKLMTRVNDARVNYILRRFCDFGAPDEILTFAKPHIGTDLLVGIVDKMLRRIEELGGKVIYRCRLDGVEELADGTLCAKTTNGDINCSSLVMAIGHSARDTYAWLMKKGFVVEPKAFSLGVRIEHLQSDIDKALLGDFAGHPKLGHAEYHLSDTSSGRGVYTFCMCPGGEVVAAASEDGGVVVNGMSKHARDGRNANSALLASVRPEDYGATPEGAIALQRRLERLAFESAGGDYFAPMQTVGDFVLGVSAHEPTRIMPTYRGGKVRAAGLDKLLPDFVTNELRLGLCSFDKKISGFAAEDAVLTGVETRSSAPVRIMRNDGLTAIGHDRIYPSGEGAGYAGGITSAAIDGVRVATAIMARFARFDGCTNSFCEVTDEGNKTRKNMGEEIRIGRGRA